MICSFHFVERTKIHQDTILVSMDVVSLYTNIPQEEGITTVCRAYDTFHNNNPPIPTKYLREMLDLILKENSFQFNGENYLQTHGTAMGTKMAVAFANIFMAEFETKNLNQRHLRYGRRFKSTNQRIATKQTSLSGAGLWFSAANGRDMLITGYESTRIPQMPLVEFFAPVMLKKLVLQLQDRFSREILAGLSSHSDGAWIHI